MRAGDKGVQIRPLESYISTCKLEVPRGFVPGMEVLPGIPNHECHLLCRHDFSRNDEVAFVLTVC